MTRTKRPARTCRPASRSACSLARTTIRPRTLRARSWTDRRAAAQRQVGECGYVQVDRDGCVAVWATLPDGNGRVEVYSPWVDERDYEMITCTAVVQPGDTLTPIAYSSDRECPAFAIGGTLFVYRGHTLGEARSPYAQSVPNPRDGYPSSRSEQIPAGFRHMIGMCAAPATTRCPTGETGRCRIAGATGGCASARLFDQVPPVYAPAARGESIRTGSGPVAAPRPAAPGPRSGGGRRPPGRTHDRVWPRSGSGGDHDRHRWILASTTCLCGPPGRPGGLGSRKWHTRDQS